MAAPIPIGVAIRRERQALGFSQNVLARRAGISQPYLSQLEAGTRQHVSATILRRLADALGIPMTELWEREGHAMPRRGRTEVWLYQMRERPDWSFADYCREVREGRLLPRHWDESESTIYRLGGRLPQPGDLIVLCFAPTGSGRAGLCGVAVITEFTASRQLRFRALPPTETLQETPRWSPRVQRLVEAIRTVAQATMWRVNDAEHVKGLLGEVFDELRGRWLEEWGRKNPAATASSRSRRVERGWAVR